MNKNPKKTLILDRDGVINVDSEDYIRAPEEWKAIPGSLEGMAELYQNGWQIYVATNQSGIARGYFSKETLNVIHQKMNAELEALGGKIEYIAHCPHTEKHRCHCRKPEPGLLLDIQKYSGLESLASVPFVGDSKRDIIAAKRAGAIPWLVLTGNGKTTKHSLESNIKTSVNLYEVTQQLLKQSL